MVTNKHILITAGPTWVAIDKARVISNIASGETGFILAGKLKKLGAKVTLLLGPGNFCANLKGVKVINFTYFSQLKNLLKKELGRKKYSVLIHAAAVSDYQPEKISSGKISSHRDSWKINLVQTEKLIDSFKNYKKLFTVGFKFDPVAADNQLIKKAKILLRDAGLNLVVANSLRNEKYRAYILDGKNKFGPFLSKVKMAGFLTKLALKNAI